MATYLISTKKSTTMNRSHSRLYGFLTNVVPIIFPGSEMTARRRQEKTVYFHCFFMTFGEVAPCIGRVPMTLPKLQSARIDTSDKGYFLQGGNDKDHLWYDAPAADVDSR